MLSRPGPGRPAPSPPVAVAANPAKGSEAPKTAAASSLPKKLEASTDAAASNPAKDLEVPTDASAAASNPAKDLEVPTDAPSAASNPHKGPQAPSNSPGFILGPDNRLQVGAQKPGKPGIPYEEMFPDVAQLLPGRQKLSEKEGILEQIRQIEADAGRLKEKCDRICDLVDEIVYKNVKASIPELVSELKEITNASKDATMVTARRFAFIGVQGVGKSFVENLMTLLGIGVSSTSLCTKAVVHYELRRTKEEQHTVLGTPIEYKDIYAELQKQFDSMSEVQDVEYLVQIHAPWVPFQADYLDVPGITATVQTEDRRKIVISIIRRLAKEKVDFVLVGDANSDPDSVTNTVIQVLAEENVTEDRIIPVLNKVNLLLASNNSYKQTQDRIDAWTNWFQNKPPKEAETKPPPKEAEKMKKRPYLFAAGKRAEFDTITSLLPQEQIVRWKAAVDEGDANLQEYAAKGLPEYPKELLGVENAVLQIKKRIVEDIMSAVDNYVNSLRNKQDLSGKDAKDILDENRFQEAFVKFTTEIPEMLKQVVSSMDGWALKIKYTGGYDFFETPKKTDERNQAGLAYFRYAGPEPIMTEPFEKRVAYIAQFSDAVSEKNGYFGTRIMLHDFSRHKAALLSCYIKFSDDDLAHLIQSTNRGAVQGCDEAVSNGISLLAQKLNIVGYLKDTIGRLACDIRRIYRIAFWVFKEKNASNKAMQVLLDSTEFRTKLQEVFDDELRVMVADSQKHMERIFGEIIDARLTITEPMIRSKELEYSFPVDFKENSLLELTKPPPPVPLNYHEGLNLPPPEWNEVFRYMEKAIKAHFSLRMLTAVAIFSNHVDATWMRMDRFLYNWMDRFRRLGSTSVVKAFKLDTADDGRIQIELAEAAYQQVIIRALDVVANNQDRLRSFFRKYNPVRDYAFPSSQEDEE